MYSDTATEMTIHKPNRVHFRIYKFTDDYLMDRNHNIVCNRDFRRSLSKLTNDSIESIYLHFNELHQRLSFNTFCVDFFCSSDNIGCLRQFWWRKICMVSFNSFWRDDLFSACLENISKLNRMWGEALVREIVMENCSRPVDEKSYCLCAEQKIVVVHRGCEAIAADEDADSLVTASRSCASERQCSIQSSIILEILTKQIGDGIKGFAKI